MTDDATYRRAVERGNELERKLDALTQQAQIWKQEAETQKSTVHECYQACTGATGEPGDWNGANPVREVVAQRDAALAECERLNDTLDKLVQWSDAYPIAVFPEPDFTKAHKVLRENGMTLDAISASNMRHVIKGVREIIDAARGKP